MKKGWVLIAMLLLSACGAGSGEVSGSGDGSGGGSGAGTPPTATVDIVVTRSATAPVSAMKVLMAAPVPTTARISITNPSVNGISFKQIQNFSIPGSVQLIIPIASGYSFELVTYTTGTPNLIEEYAVAQNVQIQAGNNTVNLTLDPIGVAFTLPATLNTGQTYSVVAVSTLNPSPFQSTWRLSTQTTGTFTQPRHLSGAASSTTQINLVAPINNNQPGTIYFQGEFFIKSSMVNLGESAFNWAFVNPNPAWGDAPLSAILSVPSGTVTITLP